MKLTILSTSDVHGYLYPTNYSTPDNAAPYGLLKAATVIRQQKQAAAADDWVIAIENGDLIQGSPLTSYVARHPDDQSVFTQLTSQIGYDVGVLGNHEFNYGLDYLRQCEQDRNYPILGANISGHAAPTIVDAPCQILENKGIRVAIIGLTTAFISHWEQADHIKNLKFESIVPVTKRLVDKLRNQVDVIVVAYHGGFERDLQTGEPTERLTGENEAMALLKAVPGIDALVTGHQHRQIAAVINGVPVTQPGERGIVVGKITLQVENGQVAQPTAELLATADAPVAAALAAQVAPLEQKVQAWLDQPVGRNAGAAMTVTAPLQARLHNHPYLDFINQVQSDATGTAISCTALFNDEVQGYQKQITLRQILNSYVYPNTLVVEEITGADLKAALERCASFFVRRADGQIEVASEFKTPKVQLYNYDVYRGIDYTFDLRQPSGERVVRLQYQGRDVTPLQKLKIVLNQYRGNGGGNYPMYSADKVVQEYPLDMTELIQHYFEVHPTVMAVMPENFQVKY